MNREEFVELFRDIATSHIDIANDDKNHSFGRIIMSAPPFQGMEVTEFINKLRSTAKFPFLIIASYDINYIDNRSDNRMKELISSFFILKPVSKEDYDKRDTVLNDCEEIADDILSYLRKYFKDNPGDTSFSIDTTTLEAIGPVDGDLFGVRVDFTLLKAANAQTAFNAEKWL